jgi:hypothetical protein
MENINYANAFFLSSLEFDNNIEKKNIIKAKSILNDMKYNMDNIELLSIKSIIKKIYDISEKEYKILKFN